MILKFSWNELRAAEETSCHEAFIEFGGLVNCFKKIADQCDWKVEKIWSEEDQSWTFIALDE